MIDRMFDALERNMAASQYAFDCLCSTIFVGSAVAIWVMLS